jgi:CubicO group peptidase (beta-lactamase class C family)
MPSAHLSPRLVYRQLSLSLVAIAAAAGLARAQSPLDAAIKAEQEALRAPAISVAVMEKGRVVYANAFGVADVEQQVRATTATRFRTASVAKTLTATAVLQLVERGAIDLDAPIQRYCTVFPAKPWPVTARQLLGHLGGIRHYTKPRESSGTEHFFTVTDSLKLFAADPLLFEPGSKYSYSTYGFNVLGCAIEGAAKKTYAEYMRAQVFEPAGMTHTTLDDVYRVIPDRARGYFLLDQRSFDGLPPAGQAIATVGGIFNAPLHDTSMKVPGGGLLSTPSDLLAFATALLRGTLLRPESLKMMWASQQTADGKSTGYGFGWGIGSNPDRLIVSHSGNQAGASSLFVVDTTNGLAMAVMANLEDADLGGVRKVLTGPLSPTGKYTPPPKAPRR